MKPIFSCCILNGFNLSPSCCAVYPCPYHNMTTLRRVGQLTDLINIKPLIYRRVHYTGNFIILFRSPPSIYDHQRTKCIPVSPPLIQRFTSQLTWIIILCWSIISVVASSIPAHGTTTKTTLTSTVLEVNYYYLLLYARIRVLVLTGHGGNTLYVVWQRQSVRRESIAFRRE